MSSVVQGMTSVVQGMPSVVQGMPSVVQGMPSVRAKIVPAAAAYGRTVVVAVADSDTTAAHRRGQEYTLRRQGS